jgi:hypothetical protein
MLKEKIAGVVRANAPTLTIGRMRRRRFLSAMALNRFKSTSPSSKRIGSALSLAELAIIASIS